MGPGVGVKKQIGHVQNFVNVINKFIFFAFLNFAINFLWGAKIYIFACVAINYKRMFLTLARDKGQ